MDQKLYGKKIKGKISSSDEHYLINSELSGCLKRMIESVGGAQHRLEAVRDALIDLFGEPMKEVIESALIEIASPAAIPTKEPSEESVGNIFQNWSEKIYAAKVEVSRWDFWDFISFFYTIFQTFRRILFYGGGGITTYYAIDYLHSTLLSKYPPYSACAILAPGMIRNVVSFFGPAIIKKLLPRKIMNGCIR